MEKKQEFQTSEKGLLFFDPVVLLRDILKQWFGILVIVLAVGVATFVITDAAYKPEYQTTTTLVVTNKDSGSSVYSNLSSTSALANVFTEMLNSSVFRKTVLEEAGIQDFSGAITAYAVEGTNLMTMHVTDTDPRTAFVVTRAILENHDEITRQVMGEVVLEVLQKPSVPVYPSNPLNASGTMKKAMLITALLSCLLVGWASANRDTIRSGREARKKLDCSYLGEIPHEQKYRTLRTKLLRPKTSILITNPATSFRFTENIRKIRRRVEQRMNGAKSLMVVSLVENEGKSTVAVNLALSMAQKHERVLLIDCDLRKPACAKLLRVNWTGPGVRSVLLGETDPDSAIIQDGRSGLHMLLESKSSRNSGELIGSARMAALVEWAKSNYDMVILDLPPISVATDSEAVTELADACLLVVRQNAAVAPALNKAIANLERGKAKLLGCVMNNAYTTALSSGQAHGGYGGYKGYGRYGNYGKYGAYDSRK